MASGLSGLSLTFQFLLQNTKHNELQGRISVLFNFASSPLIATSLSKLFKLDIGELCKILLALTFCEY